MEKKILISYVPLLQADKTKIYAADDPILLQIPTRPTVSACLWGRYQSYITPVLAIERAKEVISHLTEWSDGRPEKWFKLYVSKEKGKYIMTLFPDLKQIIEEVKNKNPEINMKEIQVICKPLYFISEDLSLFTRVQWQENSYLGLIDNKDINVDDIPGMIGPTILGPFQLGDPKSIQSFINILLKNK